MPSFWNRGSNSAAGPGDAHVGGQRQVQPGADGRAVDRGDRRQRAVGDGEEAVVDHAQAVLGGLAERGEVGAGAERLACAGHDQRVHVGVGLGGVDGRAQGRGDLGGDGVAAVGVVDGDEGDAVVDVDQYRIGHGPAYVPRSTTMMPTDNHVHTRWSWDTATTSSMQLACARAVEIGLPGLAFTEHVDFTEWSHDDAAAITGMARRPGPRPERIGGPDPGGTTGCRGVLGRPGALPRAVPGTPHPVRHRDGRAAPVSRQRGRRAGRGGFRTRAGQPARDRVRRHARRRRQRLFAEIDAA